MNRRLFWVLLGVAAACLSFGAPTVAAHVLGTHGSIGVSMHIDPDDEPVAGAISTFYFWFKDTAGRLTPKNCDGTFAVTQGGDQLVSRPLFPNPSNPSLDLIQTWTFPKPGVYTIHLSGWPNTPNTFESFEISFDVRVDHSATAGAETPSWLSEHWFHLVLGLIGAAIVVLLLVLRPARSKR